MHQIIWHGSERSNAYLVFIFLHAQMCSWCTWIIFFQYLQVSFSLLSFYWQALTFKWFYQCLRESMLYILMWKACSRSDSALVRIFELHRFLREVNVFEASQPPLNKVHHILINSLEIAFSSLCSATLFAKTVIYFCCFFFFFSAQFQCRTPRWAHLESVESAPNSLSSKTPFKVIFAGKNLLNRGTG